VRLLLLPAPLLLLCGCAGPRLHAKDVADAFAADAAALVDRQPEKADLDPARAANAADAMRETERAARTFLDGKTDDMMRTLHVRSLLACALVAQGRAADAREALAWRDGKGVLRRVTVPAEPGLTPENAVIGGADAAVSVCRSVEAREAAERFFAGQLPAEEFVRRYGSFAGLPLGAPEVGDYEKTLQLVAANLAESCAPGSAAPGPAAGKARSELRRVLGEQIYNDAATLLERVPAEPPRDAALRSAEQDWLARVAVRSATIYRYLIPDLLPTPLTAEQKEWQREQAVPFFLNARARAAWFLDEEARRRVEETRAPRTPLEVTYDRLLSAQLETLAWIASR
jgi:hypothetical protein